MEQMELLWQYQQEDMKAERIANDIKRSPVRQKLEKDRTLYMDYQKKYKQLQARISEMADRVDTISEAMNRLQEQLTALEARCEAEPPQDAESARSLRVEASRLRDSIADFFREMEALVKEASSSEKKQSSIRNSAAQVRAEFEQLKEVYDKESGEKKTELEAQRSVAAQKAAEVPPELLSKYEAIKKRVLPPVARLNGNQCSGCNTSLPSAVLRRIKSGSEVVECETCGRMIIQ